LILSVFDLLSFSDSRTFALVFKTSPGVSSSASVFRAIYFLAVHMVSLEPPAFCGLELSKRVFFLQPILGRVLFFFVSFMSFVFFFFFGHVIEKGVLCYPIAYILFLTGRPCPSSPLPYFFLWPSALPSPPVFAPPSPWFSANMLRFRAAQTSTVCFFYTILVSLTFIFSIHPVSSLSSLRNHGHNCTVPAAALDSGAQFSSFPFPS